MSNTSKRVYSALALLAIVSVFFMLGQMYFIGLIGFFGLLANDEIITNFFKRERWTALYFIEQLLFLFLIVFISTHTGRKGLMDLVVFLGMLFNLLYITYLFVVPIEKTKILDSIVKIPLASVVLVGIPTANLVFALSGKLWIIQFWLLLFINFGMDTGAWFVGKNLGRHKLWPSVSPNKTVEGLLGGILSSALLAGVFYSLFHQTPDGLTIFLFMMLGCLSQVGDLFQSKIKRQIGIKDSSQLIPGHGGVYDRIDSLLFVSPYFVMLSVQMGVF